MNWKRNGRGGYVGEHGDMDAQATIARIWSPTEGHGWQVVTVVFGQTVDTERFHLLADAKWHATHVASLVSVNAWPRG